MSKQIVSTSSDVCKEVYLHGKQRSSPFVPQNNGSGALAVSAPVGIGGTNLANDVTTIQDALNRVSPADGGASPLLVTDGICGQKTKEAIQKFQLQQFGWSGADGKINPGGQTITRLNEILGGANRPADGGSGFAPVGDDAANEIFKTAMTAGLLQAKRWIRAAQANLDMALVYVDQPDVPGIMPSFGRGERMRLVNRYFKIDEMNSKQRREVLQRIRLVYATMLQMFERPGGLWGEKAFEIDSTGVAFKETPRAVAHTDTGGFFKGGQRNQWQKELRGDSIFFVRENISHFTDMDKGVKTIVHEMAHFCGDERFGWAIDDFDAYGEPETPKVSKLTLAQRVRHADTYARFARTAGK